jgi:Ni,Fe-hydrogenase I cytochrome b subunit
MPQKIKTAKLMLQIMGWLNIAVAVLLILGFVVGSIFLGMSGEKGAGIVGAIMGTIGFVIGILVAVWGILSLYTASGIQKKKNWAKILGIIIAILALPSIPIGTVLGVFILIGLFSPEADNWFEA